MQLKSGTLLQGGKYRIEKVLGQGGFGITYEVTHTIFEKRMAIKEFFYKDYCERDKGSSLVSLGTQNSRGLVERFMTKFVKEARMISQFDHPNIIRIHDIFHENNTAYYVMDFIEGESLSDMVKQRGALPESEAVGYIRQIASALDFIHGRSVNHLDVKPANVMVRQSDGRAILIDFGLSKQYDAEGGQTSTTPVGISHGYAPMEQYNAGGVSTFSPQADIYSLGATFYKLVTGITPPQANEVFNDGLPAIPSHLSASTVRAITEAMRPGKKYRPENIVAFMKLLGNNEEETHLVAEETVVKSKPKRTPPPSPESAPWKKLAVSLAMVIIAALVGIFWPKGGDEDETIVQPVSIVEATGTINGHAYVNLGLSVKWADRNLGPSFRPVSD